MSAHVSSRFDQFDGYYSVRFSGVEFARFAPSPIWSDYANSMQDTEDFSYVFVTTNTHTPPPEPGEFTGVWCEHRWADGSCVFCNKPRILGDPS